MERQYVEWRNESFYLAGSRVPLARLVFGFQRGESPEAIRSHYPTLTLEEVYGALAFYLGHTNEVEKDMAEREREEEEFARTHPWPPELAEKLQRAREEMLARRT